MGAFPTGARWGGALAIVLALHGAAAWLLLNRHFPPMVMPAAPEAVMLDLAPDLPPVQPAAIVSPPPAAVPPPPPVPDTPPPSQPAPPIPVAEPPPPELPPPPPVQAEAVLPVPPPPPPPRPVVKPKPRPVERVIERQPAPPVAVPPPVQAAPPQASARPPAPASTVTPTWRNELVARLQRAKRYPDLARSRGDQGVAAVTFTMDRNGRVMSVTLVRSSGSNLLDDEAVALVHRAEPLPRLPEEMGGSTITLTVPISFALR